MKKNGLKKILLSALTLVSIGSAQLVLAHSSGGPFDFTGKNASSTDLAAVECPPGTAYLFIRVRDNSPAVPGLLVSMQALKDNKMTNVTDTVSGDGNWSNAATLNAGGGSYYISVNKTKAGLRQMEVEYHCNAAGGDHMATTDITLLQAQ
jgi:hypothetical protein